MGIITRGLNGDSRMLGLMMGLNELCNRCFRCCWMVLNKMQNWRITLVIVAQKELKHKKHATNSRQSARVNKHHHSIPKSQLSEHGPPKVKMSGAIAMFPTGGAIAMLLTGALWFSLSIVEFCLFCLAFQAS